MRYWTRGSFKYPVRITQKFWDELAQIRRSYEEVDRENIAKGRERYLLKIDTAFGTSGDDFWEALGPRPKYPQWMVDYVEPLLAAIGILGWAVILGFILSELIKG
jgi:hypothetical protein